MAVRSKLLGSGRATGPVTATIYTCPAGETAILKWLTVVNINASTATSVLLLMDAAGADKTRYHTFQLDPQKEAHLDLWQILDPTMEVAIQVVAAVGVNYWLSGTELEGAAD